MTFQRPLWGFLVCLGAACSAPATSLSSSRIWLYGTAVDANNNAISGALVHGRGYDCQAGVLVAQGGRATDGQGRFGYEVIGPASPSPLCLKVVGYRTPAKSDSVQVDLGPRRFRGDWDAMDSVEVKITIP